MKKLTLILALFTLLFCFVFFTTACSSNLYGTYKTVFCEGDTETDTYKIEMKLNKNDDIQLKFYHYSEGKTEIMEYTGKWFIWLENKTYYIQAFLELKNSDDDDTDMELDMYVYNATIRTRFYYYTDNGPLEMVLRK